MTAVDPQVSTTIVPSADLARDGGRATPRLRRILLTSDIVSAIAGWGAVIAFADLGLGSNALAWSVGLVLVLSAVTIALIAAQRLYLARACSIRAIEINRLGQAAVGAGVLSLIVPRFLPFDLSLVASLSGAACAFAFLVANRGFYRQWLQAGRRDGRFLRSVAIVGTNEEGYDLFKLVSDHPELGFRVAAVVDGGTSSEAFPDTVRTMSFTADLPMRLQTANVSGVLVASSAFGPERLNRFVRNALASGLHVHLSSGLRGVDWRRVRSQSMAHEPMLYVEPVTLAPWQVKVKRIIDVIGATVGLVVLFPVFAVAALGVWLTDRGPVFYRQQRVGRYGAPFSIIKFRTMVPNADKLYDELAQTHAGRNGPLIKISDDPRRTRVGRLLERFSIDELPQLVNVLRGEMSLVGPRPAQSREVAEFDERLLSRLDVRPGITGLWQVEARDNPSYSAYRRYDLFYLENWSVSLDLAIIVATFQRVLLRGLQALVDPGRGEVSPTSDGALALAVERP